MVAKVNRHQLGPSREKAGDAPAKEVKKPVPDELPGAPKLGRTESEDDLLKDPAP